ncbi:hypothetical protein [Salinisphaera sp. G21_0]|uniref:hypothetical protein n=1 Tax=Salinisphaera sp. G21_0 TaxID=2821094 RepID=UPI001ADC2787|nr:hypothetical protein [Salinisphaera sp. G21_0]MBO9482717.1 hypothetical protein [Salinisphaera sp. G21_0]
MDYVQRSVVSAPGGEHQLPGGAIADNVSNKIDSGGSLAEMPGVLNVSQNTPLKIPAEEVPEKSLTKRKVKHHEELSCSKSCDELMTFFKAHLQNLEFSYDLMGFTAKSTKGLRLMECYRKKVDQFKKMVTEERLKLPKIPSNLRKDARINCEELKYQLFDLQFEYMNLCFKRYLAVIRIVFVLQSVSAKYQSDEPVAYQMAMFAKKYGNCFSDLGQESYLNSVSDLGQESYLNSVSDDRLAQHWHVFISQSMELLNVCAELTSLHEQLLGKHENCDVHMKSVSNSHNVVALSLIKILDDAVSHYAQLNDKDGLNRGLGSDVKGLSNWLKTVSNKSDLFKCYKIFEVIQMISASLCIGEFVPACKLLREFIKLIDGKIDGITAELDDIEWLFYLASKALACLVCIKLSDLGNNEFKNIETIKMLLKDVMEKAERMFSLSEAECSELNDCFQRFVEGSSRDVLLIHALREEESVKQIDRLVSEEERENTRKKREISGKLKQKMARGYGFRKPVQPKAPELAAQSINRQDSQVPEEAPLPQGVQDAVKAFIADRPMAEVTAMIQSVVDDPKSTQVVKAEAYFALTDMLDKKMNKEFDRIASHTKFIYSYGRLLQAGVLPSPALGKQFKKAIRDVTDITKICGWLDSVNDALSTLSGLILRTDGLDNEFLDELASLHERIRAEVVLVSQIEATFDEIERIWNDRLQFLKRNHKLPKSRRKPAHGQQDQPQIAPFDLAKLQEAWCKLTRQVTPLRMTLEKTGEDIDRHLMSRPTACEHGGASGNDSSVAANDDSSLATNDDSSLATNDDQELSSALFRQEVQRAQLEGRCYGPEYWSSFTTEDWLPANELPENHPLTLIADALHRPLSVRAGGQQWLISEDGTATIKPAAIPKNSLNLTVGGLADPLMPHNSRAL